MKAKNRFEETKIRMVMKLKKLSHSAAVEEIARMDAARCADDENRRKEDDRGGVDVSRALTPNDGEDILMSAEEFFGEA